MIAIFDRNTDDNRLLVTKFLSVVLRHTNLCPDDRIELTRFGGVGERVWQLEANLDAGLTMTTSIAELAQIASESGQSIDELRCSSGNILLGLLDATFLFFQSVDKRIENKIASEFARVTPIADQ